MIRPPASVRGFTLTELAIVLLIVVLLIGGMLLPLTAQEDARAMGETRRTLNEVRDALVGYAVAQGRLPCPAIEGGGNTGVEAPAGGGACTAPHSGFVPGATLGLSPTDSQGYVVDAWGRRIRYAVTIANGNAFTTANEMKAQTISGLLPDLKVCASGIDADLTGAGTAAADCTAATRLADSAVAVIYSLGKNGGVGGTGTDERHNPNPNTGIAADRAFVSHEPAPNTAVDGEFDDLVVWLSANILYNRLIAAGRLP